MIPDRRHPAPAAGARRWLLPLLLVLLVPAVARSQEPDSIQDLAALDIDELARIRVTSASRRPEPIAHATAALTVLTREDIRRTGATSLPEVLRVVPGLQVARVGTRDWAISARGFNAQSSNKLLVLVDGRSVYSPIFSGVFWDAVAFPMDEIDRIEVIRGPGATLWGANAVNGVINVITRSAAESRGGRVALGGGTWDRVLASARYGFELGRTSVRVYAGGRYTDPARLADGREAEDDWTFGTGGFRADGSFSPRDQWTLQGDVHAGEGGNRLTLPTDTPPFVTTRLDDLEIDGVNLLGRWSRKFGEESELAVQAYYDRAERRQTPLFGTMTVQQVDLDVQHRFRIRRHDVVWGLGYRLADDEVTGATGISFEPAARTTSLFSAFAQDEISLVPARFTLTLGAKLEHNDYSGLEFQPNVRLLWTPGETHSVWAAVSRAARTPSRLDADPLAVAAVPESPVELQLRGSADYGSESLIAYEAGWRVQPHVAVSADLALFYNDYDELRTQVPGTVEPGTPRPVLPVLVENRGHGRSYGAELSGTWRISRRVRLRGEYTWLRVHTALDQGAPAGSRVSDDPERNPEHQAGLWASLDLPAAVELDLITRYRDALTGPGYPGYVDADVRLGWRWKQRFELSVVGQGLLHQRQREFPTIAFITDDRLIERRAYAKAVWRF